MNLRSLAQKCEKQESIASSQVGIFHRRAKWGPEGRIQAFCCGEMNRECLETRSAFWSLLWSSRQKEWPLTAPKATNKLESTPQGGEEAHARRSHARRPRSRRLHSRRLRRSGNRALAQL